MPTRSTPSTSITAPSTDLRHTVKECFVSLRRLNAEDVFRLSIKKKNGIRNVTATKPCTVNVNPINWNPVIPLNRVNPPGVDL